MNTAITYFHQKIPVRVGQVWGIFALVNPEPEAPSSISVKILLSTWPTEIAAKENLKNVKKEFDRTLVGMVKTKAQMAETNLLGQTLKKIFLEHGPSTMISPRKEVADWDAGWNEVARRFKNVLLGEEG